MIDSTTPSDIAAALFIILWGATMLAPLFIRAAAHAVAPATAPGDDS